jgi:methyl-accepting chemotaxis protein
MIKNVGRRKGLSSILVDPYKQIKIGLLFIILNFMFSATIFGIFGYYVMSIYEAVSTYFTMSSQESLVTFAKFQVPLAVCGVVTAGFVALTLFLSIRYTHTIYGPLISINRFLEELLAGKKPDAIKLRKSDELQDLAEKLNTLGARVAADQKNSGSITAINRFLDQWLSGSNPEPLRIRDSDANQELIGKLNQLLERTRK